MYTWLSRFRCPYAYVNVNSLIYTLSWSKCVIKKTMGIFDTETTNTNIYIILK